MGRRLVPGEDIPAMTLSAVGGSAVVIPEPGRLIHLQFRRFAGCPICNLHLRSFVRRHEEIEGAGVREVVFFHSPASELTEYESPFVVVADPSKRWYARFGVESGLRALLSTRVWVPLVLGVLRSTVAVVLRREKAPSRRQPNGRLGLPADVLIAGDGRVVAVKYGDHAYDQWSVDEVLALATDRISPVADPVRTGDRRPADLP